MNVEKEGMLLILQEQVVALIAVLVVVNQKKVQHFVLIVPQERIRILLHPSHATTAHKTTTKIYWAIPRAMHVPPVSVTKSKDLRRAMLFHLDRIFGTKKLRTEFEARFSKPGGHFHFLDRQRILEVENEKVTIFRIF